MCAEAGFFQFSLSSADFLSPPNLSSTMWTTPYVLQVFKLSSELPTIYEAVESRTKAQIHGFGELHLIAVIAESWADKLPLWSLVTFRTCSRIQRLFLTRIYLVFKVRIMINALSPPLLNAQGFKGYSTGIWTLGLLAGEEGHDLHFLSACHRPSIILRALHILPHLIGNFFPPDLIEPISVYFFIGTSPWHKILLNKYYLLFWLSP